MAPTAKDWDERCREVLSYLNRNRRRLRAFAEARCPRDHRLLAAVYRLSDSYWLWHVGERLTRDQVRQEVWANAGVPPDDVGHDERSPDVAKLGDPVTVYNALSLDQLENEYPVNGTFATCGGCRLTYVVEYRLMLYAAGQAVATRSRKPTIVSPARVVLVRDGDESEGPVYGLAGTAWRPGPRSVSPIRPA